MSRIPELTIFNHQDTIVMPLELLARLKTAGQLSVPKALEAAKHEGSALSNLDEVEVSLVADATIADVHLRFMNIPGATDVITFDHGEIHISVETALQQAKEFANDYERELMLYVIHGLLHLAGHEDATHDGQAKMDKLQERILSEVW